MANKILKSINFPGLEGTYFIDNYVKSINDTEPDASGKIILEQVTYTAQTLTEKQKTQARENIGAASTEEVLAALLPNAMGVGF